MSDSILQGILLLGVLLSLFAAYTQHRRVLQLEHEQKQGGNVTPETQNKKGLEDAPSSKTYSARFTLDSIEDFIEIVSHQLRTPATEIKWGVDEIQKDAQEKLSVAQRSNLDRVAENADRMMSIIESVVKLVNLERGIGVRNLHPYDPHAMVCEVIEQTEEKFSHKTIRCVQDFHYEGEVESLDPDSFEMVLSNLLENAYFYTDEGGTVTIHTEATSDGGIKIAVTDTGIGISKAKQQTMFEKFQRSKAAQERNASGMGIGLYIVKNIVEKHGGSVGFESKEGEGSTFWFTLPKHYSRRQ